MAGRPMTRLARFLACQPRLRSRPQPSPSGLCEEKVRLLQTTTSQSSHDHNAAFVFDIDGVLAHEDRALPGAREALTHLRRHDINHVLLSNGGGVHEADRARSLTQRLGVQIDESQVIQSHTPFAQMTELFDKNVLVIGGDGGVCRDIAYRYGYKNVITTGDIITACPSIWPWSKVFTDYYSTFARPLPSPISKTGEPKGLKIDAVLFFHDPRDWALDLQIVLDLLLSNRGYLGTLSSKNGDRSLPNSGYQQDGQPALHFSNPDLFWSARFPQPRLGQGGFRESLEGIWAATTGGSKAGVDLQFKLTGKPFAPTFAFAERRLLENMKRDDRGPFERVYMIGDNPLSDIKGGNDYQSRFGKTWRTVLVRTGIYTGGEPSVAPDVIVDDVLGAVKWGLEDAASS